ncbi:MAG: hypothetical protein EHM28_03415 [Spirochaetaceae bacterium]|nr:MAG: hypothetical protein EHM28_03415 [Spirochaetaceae bacterium]
MDISKTGLFNGQAVIVSFIVFLACYILVGGGLIGAAAVSKAAAESADSVGVTIPDMVFSYAPEKLVGMFEVLGPTGREAYLAMNAVDFVFAVAYGIFFFITLGWLAQRFFPSRPGLRWTGLIGVAGAIADETENIVYRLIAGGSAGLDGSLSGIAAIASPIKYMLISVSMFMVLAGGLVFIVITLRERNNRAFTR